MPFLPPCRSPLHRSIASLRSEIIASLNRSASSSRIVLGILAVVITEALLIEIAEQVERFNAHIGSIHARLNSAQKFSRPLVWTWPSTYFYR